MRMYYTTLTAQYFNVQKYFIIIWCLPKEKQSYFLVDSIMRNWKTQAIEVLAVSCLKYRHGKKNRIMRSTQSEVYECVIVAPIRSMFTEPGECGNNHVAAPMRRKKFTFEGGGGIWTDSSHFWHSKQIVDLLSSIVQHTVRGA